MSIYFKCVHVHSKKEKKKRKRKNKERKERNTNFSSLVQIDCLEDAWFDVVGLYLGDGLPEMVSSLHGCIDHFLKSQLYDYLV